MGAARMHRKHRARVPDFVGLPEGAAVSHHMHHVRAWQLVACGIALSIVISLAAALIIA